MGRVPLVGITTGINYRPKIEPYVEAVRQSGGEPRVVLPDENGNLAATVDALVLPGGADVEPGRYGASAGPEDNVRTDPDRDELEWGFLDTSLRRGIPVLAICRGLQVVNVFLGGSLFLDLPRAGFTRINHRLPPPRDQIAHTVEVTGGRFRELAGAHELEVNSRHHQAVAAVGRGLLVTARSGDGVVEGLESVDGQVVGVQCHPEDLVATSLWAQLLFKDLLDRIRSQ